MQSSVLQHLKSLELHLLGLSAEMALKAPLRTPAAPIYSEAASTGQRSRAEVRPSFPAPKPDAYQLMTLMVVG